jgi:hypothetical protein
MTDHTKLIERLGERYGVPDLSTDHLLRRRDRKRRNQRIAAGVVGIAFFVAAVWIVTTGGAFDRTQTPAVPGGASTGPAETGPAPTGPSLTSPTVDPFSLGSLGLPPEKAAPSEPLHGELVMSVTGINPWYAVNVYADGRLIWARDFVATGEFVSPEGFPHVSTWIQQRLTPEGVQLLLSGAVPLGGQYENPGAQLPASAWEDPKLRAYVASRYAICLRSTESHLSSALRQLPPQAQHLLRGTERTFQLRVGSIECFAVTLDTARALIQIFMHGGGGLSPWENTQGPGGFTIFVDPHGDYLPALSFEAILPDGNNMFFVSV